MPWRVEANLIATAPMTSRIRGQVLIDGRPAPGLAVEARKTDDEGTLGADVTDLDGLFAIELTGDFGIRSGSVEVEVHVSGSERHRALWDPSLTDPLSITLDTSGGSSAVLGRVRTRGGTPVEDVSVEAFHIQVNAQRTSLGSASSDRDGSYKIDYSSEAGSSQSRANILVEARDAHGTLLAASNVRAQAPRLCNVDLVVPDWDVASQRFERRAQHLAELVEPRSLDRLTEDDCRLLAAELGVSIYEFMRLAAAVRLHRQATAIKPGHGIPVRVFERLVGDDHEVDLADPIVRSRVSLADMIANQGGAAGQRLSPQIVDALIDLQVAIAVREPLSQQRLRTLEGHSALDPENCQRVIRAIALVEGDLGPVWERLAADPVIGRHVPQLRRLLELDDLTEHNADLIAVLNADDRDLSYLAAYDPDWWEALIAETGLPVPTDADGRTQTALQYARTVSGRFRSTFPLAHLAASLESDPGIEPSARPSAETLDALRGHAREHLADVDLRSLRTADSGATELARPEAAARAGGGVQRELRTIELSRRLVPNPDDVSSISALFGILSQSSEPERTTSGAPSSGPALFRALRWLRPATGDTTPIQATTTEERRSS